MQRGAYISSLPSTPQMARYTAARSAYTDPTVQASPPAWWGSSLGGCAGCGDLGQTGPVGTGVVMAAGIAGGIAGYSLTKQYTKSTLLRVLGALAGWQIAGGIAYVTTESAGI